MADAVDELLAEGMKLHQGGKLAEAEGIYRKILELRPGDAGVLHLMGLMKHQSGDSAAGEQLIRRAISGAIAGLPGVGDFHRNLGAVLAAQGKLEVALASYQRAAALCAGDAEAHLGAAVLLARLGRHQLAIGAAREALSIHSNLVAALNVLGGSLVATGQMDAAAEAYEKSVGVWPDQKEIWVRWAEVFVLKGDLAGARGRLEGALERWPLAVDLLGHYGSVLKHLGFREEAMGAFQKALAIWPGAAQIRLNLAGALVEAGRKEEAIQVMREGVQLEPSSAAAHGNFGRLLLDVGVRDEAVGELEAALGLEPGVVKRYCDLAEALSALDRYDDAVCVYRRAIAVSPNSPEANHNLGLTLLYLAQPEDAMRVLRHAQSLDPNNERVGSNLVLAAQYHPGFDTAGIRRILAEWDERYAKRYRKAIVPHGNVRDPEKRLRIGYVSADFRSHVVARNIEPLLREHDRGGFEIFCYSNSPSSDAVTEKLKGYVDHWRNIRVMTDDAAAEVIRNDGIDILVDFAMHTSHHRLLIFARKPAPVQMCFAGYPGETGVRTMDFRVSDPYLDPVIDGSANEKCADGFEREGAKSAKREGEVFERVLQVPDCFWCFDPEAMGVAEGFEVGELPALSAGFVTFGSLNMFCKMNDAVLSLWARVLKRVENSRLLILAPVGTVRERILRTFSDGGVDPARVEMEGRRDRLKYMKLYDRIDVGLDTFPWNSHSTGMDSLWMGVPIVTLVGSTITGRAGWSQLSNLGLQELAANREEEFVKIAARVTGDLPNLAEIRRGMRGRMLGAGVCDGKLFARSVEGVLREGWRGYCR
jgi:protein O-GlcNAc transferase